MRKLISYLILGHLALASQVFAQDTAPILPINSAPVEPESKLLNIQSMIGPMQDATRTFSRLDIGNGWEQHVEIIPTGPRTDQAHVPWSYSAYTWTSPVFYHRPLYFEQPNLERYGNGPHRIFQPALSSAHFFMSAPMIPAKMLFTAPWDDVYTLGELRPGNRVPWQTHSFFVE